MDLLTFAALVGKLKTVKRTGWVQKGIHSSESVAEHSFRVALLCSILAPALKLNEAKAIKMALFHDLAEAQIGDIVARNGATVLPNYPDKIQKEKEVFTNLTAVLGDSAYEDLYNEYQENKTDVARFVKQVDKLEMAIQAYEYEKDQGIHLEPFFETAESLIENEEIKKILGEIQALRKH